MRGLKEPDPAQAVVASELAGADGISMLLPRDRRNLRERDMYLLKELVQSRLMLEIPPVPELLEKALEVRPSMVTLVADQADSESPPVGIDFDTLSADFSEMTGRLRGSGIGACFLVEPDEVAVRGASKAGANAVLINCRDFSDARNLEQAQEALDKVDAAAAHASKAGLAVRAGGGLSLKNIRSLVELGYIQEFVIGHALISRALMVGLSRAVSDFLRAVRGEPAELS
jgi:pyridoxine 5-phosphate synthase